MIQDKIFKDKKIARPFYVGLAALILMCICSVVMCVKLVILRDNELKALTVGTNAVGIFFCTAIYPGCILGIRHNRAIARFFGVMLLLTGMTQLLEISMILLDERPPFRMLLLSASILYGILERVILFALWRYVIALFRIEPGRVQASNRFVAVMLVPSTLLCLIDLWTPFFGGVDATGDYFLAGHQLLDMSYGIIVCLAIAITMVRVGIRPGRILTVLSYILIPGVVLGLTWNKPDLNIQHVASALTLTLIYSVLNSESARRTAAMEKELSMAGQIQNSMLPDVDTDTSIPPQVELYASMQPAKEVGGDFFDYFRLGEDRFAFLVADVADKGAPAAMIMAISKSLIKLRASVGGTPGEVLKSVSEWLITDGSSVFVTAWLGILDLNSGEVAACNAGHTQPAILHVSGEEGYTLKKLPHGAAMGLMPGMKFRDFTLQLAPGDRIFLYTDGLVEAQGRDGKMFGPDRMMEVLNGHRESPNREVCRQMSEAVAEFVGDDPQFDDLTMLELTYLGAQGKEA